MQKIKRTFSKEYLLNLKIRRAIYKFILENPGFHLSEIVRRINIPRSTLKYHLLYLEKQGFIIEKKNDKYNRYFVSKDIGDREKEILNLIRVETTRDVLLYIMITVSASQIEIAKELDKHPTTINFHLKRLIKHNLIEPAPTENGLVYTLLRHIPTIKRKKSKNEIFYRLKDPEIANILIIYYEKRYYHDVIAEAILTYIEDIEPLGRPPKRYIKLKEAMERVEKTVFDVFPHPYYA